MQVSSSDVILPNSGRLAVFFLHLGPGLQTPISHGRGWPEHRIRNLFSNKTLLERAGLRTGTPSMDAFLFGAWMSGTPWRISGTPPMGIPTRSMLGHRARLRKARAASQCVSRPQMGYCPSGGHPRQGSTAVLIELRGDPFAAGIYDKNLRRLTYCDCLGLSASAFVPSAGRWVCASFASISNSR